MRCLNKLALLLVFFSSSAFAIVDMRLANYSDTWTDLELPGSGYDLKVVRTYNSRSLYNGMFGFGWCSDFETAFTPQADGTIKLKECGDGKVITFVPKTYDTKITQKLINDIIAAVKKKSPNHKKKYLNSLKKELTESSKLRQEYADRYNVRLKGSSSVYYNQAQSGETLQKKGKYYERKLADGNLQRFDLQGRLTFMYDKNRNYLKFNYSKNRLHRITDNSGRQLAFKYYPNGKVKTITGPNRLTVEYAYSKLSDLAKVRSAWGNTYTYQYDELHNLTQVNYPDKTSKKITYNTDKDWVTGFKSRTNCQETYNYTLSESDPKGHYWADVLKKCDGEVVTNAKFEFWYKDSKHGVGKYLARTRSEVNGTVSDTVFSDKFGRPTKTVYNGVETNFTYYPNGLLKTRKSGKETAFFKYDKVLQKVSEVRIGKRVTKFKYDKRGNLLAADSTTGQKVRIAYDKKGRIVKLMDQAKRLVKIDYNEQFGKPARVQRPGVGEIRVRYKPNGDIEKIDSDQGPKVAVQIASTFNSLLDIIAPAGIDLNL